MSAVAQLRGDDTAERRRVEDGPWPGALAVVNGNALVFPARDDRVGQFGIAIGRRRHDADIDARLALGAAQAQDAARRPAIDEGRGEIGADVNDAKTHSARGVDDVIRQACRHVLRAPHQEPLVNEIDEAAQVHHQRDRQAERLGPRTLEQVQRQPEDDRRDRDRELAVVNDAQPASGTPRRSGIRR